MQTETLAICYRPHRNLFLVCRLRDAAPKGKTALQAKWLGSDHSPLWLVGQVPTPEAGLRFVEAMLADAARAGVKLPACAGVEIIVGRQGGSDGKAT